MRTLCLCIGLVFCPVVSVADTKFGVIDYVGPYAERVIDNGADCSGGSNIYGISQAKLALEAAWVTIGLETAVSTTLAEAGNAVAPASGLAVSASSCFRNTTPAYENVEFANQFVDEVNTLRRVGGANVIAMAWSRPDTVNFVHMAMLGFDRNWILDTARPWQQVLDFFDANSDYVCGSSGGGSGVDAACGGLPCSNAANQSPDKCGFNFCYSGTQWEPSEGGSACTTHRMDKYLVALGGGPTEYQTKVHYFPHQSGIVATNEHAKKRPWGSSVLMDLANPAYREWYATRLARMFGVISNRIDSFTLTWKPGQYFCRESASGSDCGPAHNLACARAYRDSEQWIGGDGTAMCGAAGGSTIALTHSEYIADGDTPWSAQPTSYKWTDYVQGFRAITDLLRARQVPYSIALTLSPWWSVNEGGIWDGPNNCGPSGTSECSFNDDPTTSAVNENDETLAIFRGAKRVFFNSGSTNVYDRTAIPRMVADLQSHGVEVIPLPSMSFSNYADRPQ